MSLSAVRNPHMKKRRSHNGQCRFVVGARRVGGVLTYAGGGHGFTKNLEPFSITSGIRARGLTWLAGIPFRPRPNCIVYPEAGAFFRYMRIAF